MSTPPTPHVGGASSGGNQPHRFHSGTPQKSTTEGRGQAAASGEPRISEASGGHCEEAVADAGAAAGGAPAHGAGVSSVVLDGLVAEAPTAEGLTLRGVSAGVTVGFLRRLAARVGPRMTTEDVVRRVIVPATARWRCRLAALLPPEATARATVFVSHTWGGSFADVAAAASHALDDTDGVWLDVVAVPQHPPVDPIELDFAGVILQTTGLLLVTGHVPAVAKLRFKDVRAGRVPVAALAAAQAECAFFRVWCLVELVTATLAGIPVALLVGQADPTTRSFAPNPRMLNSLFHVIDVASAEATLPTDRDRILAAVRADPGIDTANTLCRGAVQGAIVAMRHRAVLQAALGRLDALASVQGRSATGHALCAAAAAGFVAVVDQLLARDRADVDLEATDPEHGNTPLGNAASGGHLAVVQRLLAAGASLKSRNIYGLTPLMESAGAGHAAVAAALADAGADVDAQSRYGVTSLMYAARRGSAPTVEALVAAGANTTITDTSGKPALVFARESPAAAAHLARIEAALARGDA
jgi:hypothetical protein